MRSIILAVGLTLSQPCQLALAGNSYVYLIAPLEKPTADSSVTWTMSPYLIMDTQKASSETLQSALRALKDPNRQLTIDEADVIVSALKAANESDKVLQNYLESQMTYSMADAVEWTRTNLPRPVPQGAVMRVREARANMERKAIGLTAVGLGVGGLLTSLPIAAIPLVGIFPALALAQVSGSIISAGLDVMRDPKLVSVIDRQMPDLMVALLGPQLSRPGVHVPYWQFTYGPENELVKRLRHAALLRNVLVQLGTPELLKLSTAQSNVLSTDQDLYAHDLVVGAMVLSVMSRQMDEGAHIKELSKFVAAIPEEQLVPFGQMAEALANSSEAMLGIAVNDQENKHDARKREVEQAAAWAQAAVLVRAQATAPLSAGEVNARTERLLGPDANFANFDKARATATIAAARAETATLETSNGPVAKAREKYNRLVDRFKALGK